MIQPLLHGLILAGGLILPLGVQNVFIFNQGAAQPRLSYALPAVVTAALCDNLLVIAAVMGATGLVLAFGWLKLILLGAGMLFLIYVGWTTWASEVSQNQDPAGTTHGVRKQVLFAASVSLLNPHAILDTVVVIGGNSLQYHGPDRMTFAVAVAAVSWLWFIGLACAGRLLGRIDTTGAWMNRINKISALIIWGTALYMAWQLFH